MPIIALDADGVLLNYHEAYRLAWARAFGVLPGLRDPQAYWPIDRWEVAQLEGSALQHFRTQFNEQFWTSIPAIDGAVDACRHLQSAGYELVCVSALPLQFGAARLQNLRDYGFPIERMIATDCVLGEVSPKAAALQELSPVAFVDDYLPYLRGLPASMHAALIMREPNGSPNVGAELAVVHSQHNDLAAFANWWLLRN